MKAIRDGFLVATMSVMVAAIIVTSILGMMA